MSREEEFTVKTLLSSIKEDLRESKSDLKELRSDMHDKWETTFANHAAQKAVITSLSRQVSDINALLTKGANGKEPLVHQVSSLREDSLKFKTTLDETKKTLDGISKESTITPTAVRVEQWKITGSIIVTLITIISGIILAYLGVRAG